MKQGNSYSSLPSPLRVVVGGGLILYCLISCPTPSQSVLFPFAYQMKSDIWVKKYLHFVKKMVGLLFHNHLTYKKDYMSYA